MKAGGRSTPGSGCVTHTYLLTHYTWIGDTLHMDVSFIYPMCCLLTQCVAVLIWGVWCCWYALCGAQDSFVFQLAEWLGCSKDSQRCMRRVSITLHCTTMSSIKGATNGYSKPPAPFGLASWHILTRHEESSFGLLVACGLLLCMALRVLFFSIHLPTFTIPLWMCWLDLLFFFMSNWGILPRSCSHFCITKSEDNSHLASHKYVHIVHKTWFWCEVLQVQAHFNQLTIHTVAEFKIAGGFKKSLGRIQK